MRMFNFGFYVFICVNLIFFSSCNEVREELCADTTCTVPISQARGIVRYTADKSGRLSFTKGKEMTIISKTKKEGDLWGAIIDGNRGYVPSHLVREGKIFHATNTLIPVKIKPVVDAINNTSPYVPDVSESNSNKKPELEESISNFNVYDLSKGSDVKSHDNLINAKPDVVGHSEPEKYNIKSDDLITPKGTFKVIEGTTMFDYGMDEITPSTVLWQTPPSALNNPNVPSDNQLKGTSQPSSVNNPDKLAKANAGESLNVLNSENTVSQIESSSAKVETKGNVKNANYGINEISNNEDYEDDIADVEDEDDEEEEDDYDSVDDMNSDSNINASSAEAHLNTINNDISTGKSIENNTVSVDKSVNVMSKSSQVSSELLPEKKTTVDSVTVTENKAVLEDNSLMQNETSQIPIMNEAKISKEESVTSLPTIDFASPENKASKPEITFNASHVAYAQEIKVDDFKPKEKNDVPKDNLNSFYNSMFSSEVPIQSNNNEASHDQEKISLEETTPTLEEKTIHYQTLPMNVVHEYTTSKIIEADITTENPLKTAFSSPDYNPAGTGQASYNAENKEPSTETPQYQPSTLSEVNNNFDPLQYESSTVSSIKNNIETTEHESSTVGHNFDPLQYESSTASSIDNDIKVAKYESSTSGNTNNNFGASQNEPSTVSDVNNKIETVQFESSSVNDANNNVETPEESNEEIEGVSFITQVTDALSGWFGSKSNEESANEKNAYDSLVVETSSESTEAQKEPITLPYSQDSEPTLDEDGEEQPFFWNYWLTDNLPGPSKTFIYLVVTAVTVLVFTLGHNFIEKKVKSGPLIAKINKLEQKLFVTSKECLQLKDEIQKAKEKISLYENSSNDELIVSLQLELEESKKARAELESSIEILQQELDSATEAGLDLNKMLSEVLTQKGGSESLLESVENLQSQLNNQQRIIDEMTNKLGVKNEENETLHMSLDAANEKIEALEVELEETKSNLNFHLKEKDSTTQDLKSQIDQLHSRINQLSESKQKEIAKLKKQLEELKKEIKEKTDELAVKDEECKAIKQATKQLKGKGNANFEALFDVSKVKAQLAKVEKDYQTEKEELQKERAEKKMLESRIEVLEAEIKKLNELCESAKQKEDEALKKLEVLSTYFKEKETQLQKELVCQEALWAQKKGDENAVYNMMKSLQEEVESYKSQNETLKKEILDQERGLKNQIASLEQKAHENWVAARQAERKLEENKQESAQLRNRLTLMEKSGSSDAEGKPNSRAEDLNGVEAVSPVIPDASSPLLFPPLPLDPASSALLPPNFMPHPMFMPPPMSGFMPPPPFLPGDRRPPPLGRMSSPPLNSQFSPPPPPLPHDYSYERMSPPPLSPLARSYRSSHDGDREKENTRHKSPPYPPMYSRNWDGSNNTSGFIPIASQKESKREHKGSKVSSGHSSSDSLDQSNKNSSRI